jgi:hypothetical protein
MSSMGTAEWYYTLDSGFEVQAVRPDHVLISLPTS